MDKQNNKALAGVNVEKMTIDATINQKQMTSGKVMLLMNNTETKEALDITIDFDLKNVNEDVKVREVEVKDYSVAIDGMGFFKQWFKDWECKNVYFNQNGYSNIE
ncbi:MAG: hypothetical protein RR578_01725 [Bacilli bacterium]